MKKIFFVIFSITILSFLAINTVNAQAAPSKIKTLTEADFDSNIKSGLVFVDFYADWCRPCKMMQPVLEEFAGEQAGKIVVAKIDTDKNKSMVQKYQISGIPCMILFKDGKEVKRVVGYKDKAALNQELASYLK